MGDDRQVTASDQPDAPHRGGAFHGQSAALATNAFLLELAAFASLGYAGWQLGEGITQLLLVFALPTAAIVVWGLFVAPKAKVHLPEPARLTIELAVYAAAVVGLLLAGAVVLGLVFAVLVVVFQLTRARSRRRRTPAARPS